MQGAGAGSECASSVMYSTAAIGNTSRHCTYSTWWMVAKPALAAAVHHQLTVLLAVCGPPGQLQLLLLHQDLPTVLLTVSATAVVLGLTVL